MSRAGFDPGSGTITLDDRGELRPATTRASFLASPLAQGAMTLVLNEPHASWAIARTIAGRPFRIALYFEADRLAMLTLALAEPEFGRSWADWSSEGEERRRAAHDAWLTEADASIGTGREYDWGFVSSIFEERSGGSEIVIRYGAPLTDAPPVSPIRFAAS